MAAPGYVRDIQALVEAYGKDENAHSFSHFRELWKSLTFTFIHEGRPKEIGPLHYTQVLYATALDYLNGSKGLSYQLGGLYTIYTLYKTQPCRPEVLIYLSKANVLQMLELLQRITEHQLEDAFHVVLSLVQSKAFVYGLVVGNATEAVDMGVQKAEQAKLKIEKARKLLLNPDTMKAYFSSSILDKINLEEVERTSLKYKETREAALEGSLSFLKESNLGDYVRNRVSVWDKKRNSHLNRFITPTSKSNIEDSMPLTNMEEGSGLLKVSGGDTEMRETRQSHD